MLFLEQRATSRGSRAKDGWLAKFQSAPQPANGCFAIRPGISVPPSQANDGSWCQKRGSNGKSLRKARRMGPVDGQNVLGRVKIGPGGAAGRAILVRGTTANLPAGQVGPSAVAENTPSSNRRGRRAKRDPLMDRGRLKRSQSDQEGPRAGGCQGGGGVSKPDRQGDSDLLSSQEVPPRQIAAINAFRGVCQRSVSTWDG